MNTQQSLFSIFKSSPLFIALAVAAVVVFVSYQLREAGGFWSPEVEARVFTNNRDGRSGEVGLTRRFPSGRGLFGCRTVTRIIGDYDRQMLISADRRLNNRPI